MPVRWGVSGRRIGGRGKRGVFSSSHNEGERMRVSAAAVSMLAVGLACGSLSAEVAFTSVYTAMDSCKDACKDCGDGDVPQKCRGVGGYGVYESYSAAQTFRAVEAGEGFSVDLAPAIMCNYTAFGERIEWRCANGKPFAVIHRVSCYYGEPDDLNHIDTKADFKGEFLLVRGLVGMEKLCIDVDVRKDKKANDTARKAADDFYRKQAGAVK
jgi:hypothetical protein